MSNLAPCRGHVTTFPFRVPSDRGALVGLHLAGFIMAPNNNNFGIEPLTAIASQDC